MQAGLAALLVSLSAPGGAEVLKLANGDQLTGTLVETRDGVLHFKSDLLGLVEVPEAMATVEPGEVEPPPSPVPAPTPTSTPTWTADLGLRLSVDRGSLETPEEDFRASLKTSRPTPFGVVRSGLDYRHKRTNGALKDNDWRVDVGYEHFLSADRFVAGRLLATRELTSGDYDETRAALASMGWRLWEKPGQFLRIGPALGYLDAVRKSESFQSPALGLYATAEARAWAGVRFNSELVVLDAFGEGQYANLELRLRQPLGERLYLALVWNYAWSNLDIEPGLRSEWRWDIGWRFGPDGGK